MSDAEVFKIAIELAREMPAYNEQFMRGELPEGVQPGWFTFCYAATLAAVRVIESREATKH